MTQLEYINQLTAVLHKHTEALQQKLLAILQHLPPKATQLHIIIFPNQEGDGAFNIHAAAEGPDLYTLNHALQPWASLFVVIHTEHGVVPDVPIVNSFDPIFPVNDTLTDTVAQWISTTWKALPATTIPMPVYLLADDEYGSITPLQLH